MLCLRRVQFSASRQRASRVRERLQNRRGAAWHVTDPCTDRRGLVTTWGIRPTLLALSIAGTHSLEAGKVDSSCRALEYLLAEVSLWC